MHDTFKQYKLLVITVLSLFKISIDNIFIVLNIFDNVILLYFIIILEIIMHSL